MESRSKPPPIIATVTASPSPTPEQLRQIGQAARTHRVLRRAARTALSSAATTLLIGAVSALGAVFWPDWKSVAMSLAVLAVGAVEYVGHKRLLRADPAAPRLLMRNQLAFLAAIVAYCVLQLLTFSTDALKNEAISPEFRQQLHQMPSMERSIDGQIETWGTLMHQGLYAGMILISIGFQGGMAWYYATRKKHVEAFRKANPTWAQQVVTRVAT